MRSRDTCGRSLSDGRGGSVVALGEGPKRCVLPESQQPGEAFSRGNEAAPLCYFTWLLIENTATSYRETLTSAFGSIQRVLSCFTPQQKGGEKKRPEDARTPPTAERDGGMAKNGRNLRRSMDGSRAELWRHWPPSERSPEVFQQNLTPLKLKQGWEWEGWQNVMHKNNSDEIWPSKDYQSNQWKQRLDAKPVKPGGSQCNVQILLGHLPCCVGTPLHAGGSRVRCSVQVLPGELS